MHKMSMIEYLKKCVTEYRLYTLCVFVTILGVFACIAYGQLLSGYLDWSSSKKYHEDALTVLKNECREFEAKRNEYYKTMDALKLEVEALSHKREQLANVEKRLHELQCALAATEKTSSRLSGETELQGKALQDKKQAVAVAEEERARLMAELENLKVEVKTENEKLNALMARISALDNDRTQKGEMQKRLTEEISEAEKQKNALQTQIADLQSQLSELQGKISAFEQEDTQLSERLKTMRSERDAVQKQIAELQGKLDDMTSSRANAKRLEQERKMADLQAKMATLNADIQKTENTLKSLSSELAEVTRRRDVLQSECAGLDALKTEKQAALDALKKDIEKLTSQKVEIEAELNSKREAMPALQHDIEEQERRKAALLAECAELDAALAGKRAEQERMKTEQPNNNENN